MELWVTGDWGNNGRGFHKMGEYSSIFFRNPETRGGRFNLKMRAKRDL